MMQFKTVAIPSTELKVKAKDMYTVKTANEALAPVGKYIQEEAKGGWTLHSYVVIPAVVKRKKGILELILGWIPVIGMIWSNLPAYYFPNYYSLIFQKEV